MSAKVKRVQVVNTTSGWLCPHRFTPSLPFLSILLIPVSHPPYYRGHLSHIFFFLFSHYSFPFTSSHPSSCLVPFSLSCLFSKLHPFHHHLYFSFLYLGPRWLIVYAIKFHSSLTPQTHRLFLPHVLVSLAPIAKPDWYPTP